MWTTLETLKRGMTERNDLPDLNLGNSLLRDFCASYGLSIMNTMFKHNALCIWYRHLLLLTSIAAAAAESCVPREGHILVNSKAPLKKTSSISGQGNGMA